MEDRTRRRNHVTLTMTFSAEVEVMMPKMNGRSDIRTAIMNAFCCPYLQDIVYEKMNVFTVVFRNVPRAHLNDILKDCNELQVTNIIIYADEDGDNGSDNDSATLTKNTIENNTDGRICASSCDSTDSTKMCCDKLDILRTDSTKLSSNIIDFTSTLEVKQNKKSTPKAMFL